MIFKILLLLFVQQNFVCGLLNRKVVSSNGWTPLMYPPQMQPRSYAMNRERGLVQTVPESKIRHGESLYVTPEPLARFVDKYAVPVLRNKTVIGGDNNKNVVRDDRSASGTLQKRTFDDRRNLEAMIDKKIEKSLESFFDKFNKMLETVVKEANKKNYIHHSSPSPVVAEAGNEGVSPLPHAGTLDYTAEEEDTEPSRNTRRKLVTFDGNNSTPTIKNEKKHAEIERNETEKHNASIESARQRKQVLYPTVSQDKYDQKKTPKFHYLNDIHKYNAETKQNVEIHKGDDGLSEVPRLKISYFQNDLGENLHGDKAKHSLSIDANKSRGEVQVSTVTEGESETRNSRVIKSAYPQYGSYPALLRPGYNSPNHSPPDPFVALFLSHYGKYLPGSGYGNLYSYLASNNLHNNKPFGSYKIYEDTDG